MKKALILGIAAALLLAGCMTLKAKYRLPDWEPGTIAVLPFTNESSDVAVEKFARVVMYKALKKAKYRTLPLEEIDAALENMGITEGGQLPTATAAEIAEALDADSLLYGNILVAKRVLLGVYFDKRFKANFRIYDAVSGELAWEDERESGEKKIELNAGEVLKGAARSFAAELAGDAIYKLLDSHPLIEHIRNVVDMSVRTLP